MSGRDRMTPVQPSIARFTALVALAAASLAAGPSAATGLVAQPERLREQGTRDHRLSEVVVFDRSAKVLFRSDLSLSMAFDQAPPEDLARAANGEIVFHTTPDGSRVRAPVAVDSTRRTFLYVGQRADVGAR